MFYFFAECIPRVDFAPLWGPKQAIYSEKERQHSDRKANKQKTQNCVTKHINVILRSAMCTIFENKNKIGIAGKWNFKLLNLWTVNDVTLQDPLGTCQKDQITPSPWLEISVVCFSLVCIFKKYSPNIQLMWFSLHKWRNSFTHVFLVTDDLSGADLVHADFCKT